MNARKYHGPRNRASGDYFLEVKEFQFLKIKLKCWILTLVIPVCRTCKGSTRFSNQCQAKHHALENK
jgi:hypothetical protein